MLRTQAPMLSSKFCEHLRKATDHKSTSTSLSNYMVHIGKLKSPGHTADAVAVAVDVATTQQFVET